MCSYFQSSLIPLQLSNVSAGTSVSSDNSMTEPVERSPSMLGTAVLEALLSFLLLYSHIVPSGLC